MEYAEDIPENHLEGGVTITEGFENDNYRLRTYQAEMVEKSLEANIIVAMDTGTGKTHIALSRTAAELETCDPNQLVWFLAPTVTLCEQQFAVFQAALPAYSIKMLSGQDATEHWSDQAIWDGVLENARIILSTHAILLDALTHGFVKMSKLALIIFDEAHHCTLNHPANQIMTNFYKPLLLESSEVWRPRILGLSASPVMRAKADQHGLQEIEENMNSIAKTPKIHRSEFLRFVHKPELLKVPYPVLEGSYFPLLTALNVAHIQYDLETDPWVIRLLNNQRQGLDSSKQLQKVFMSNKTYCAEQLKKFASKAQAMYEELGRSATDWYIHQCIWKFENMVRVTDPQLFDWSRDEQEHLLKILKTLPLSDDLSQPMSIDEISPKVEKLIDILVTEAGEDFTGLVFAEQRVWVAALAEILCLHPKTRDLITIGTFVGTSQSSKRRGNIADLVEAPNQEDTLDDFRTGKKNIILSTSVLEEGIDISSCHLVVCFERPKNLKSFIQRRGRARKQKSKYLIFQAESTGGSPEIWESLEEEMKAAYLNDLREVKQAEEREDIDEEGGMFYKVPSTGALLTLDNAMSHLNHFCSLLGSGPYIDTRPQFSFTSAAERLDQEMSALISAEVTLPISVDQAMRKARSSQSWMTERMAKKDAAFQAYRILHLAGLVNDNLLPVRQEEDDLMQEFQIPDHTPSLVEVSPSFDPWQIVVQYQQQNPYTYHRIHLKIHTIGEDPFYLVLLVPCSMPPVAPFSLHWNNETQYSVESSWLPGTTFTEEELTTLRAITRTILFSIHHGRMKEERYDFLALLAPSDAENPIWTHTELHNFNVNANRYWSASDLIQQGDRRLSNWGLVSLQGDLRKYIVKGVSSETVEFSTGKSGHELQVIRVPRRRDFLHQIPEKTQESIAYTRIELFNATECVVDDLPTSYSILALFIPSILRTYEDYMIADTLRTTLMKPVSFEVSHLPLLLQALTSSTASSEHNYQRLEFLGDCILKFIASLHVMASHLKWPEGYLTAKKGKIVSNGYLARATMKAGLDQFVINKSFTGAKWTPRYVGDVLTQQPPKDKIMRSSKLLADVIESLIGASYVKGGFSDAFLCVQTLLTMETWTPIPEANLTLLNAASTDFRPTNLTILEELIGYKFIKKALLLEAVTHVSYTGPNVNCSYERLEFLGDAVLDYIVSKRLYAHVSPLGHPTMHAIRTAMVNASFLTFCMFETTLLEPAPVTPGKPQEPVSRALWQFMRHSNHTLLGPRDLAIAQHNAAREQINDALRNDQRFPWHLLSLTDAPKFLSDIVESVIGGIYVDSQGSIEACEIFVRKLGILDALERILQYGVDCLHPKERLGHLAVERRVQYVKIKPKEGNGNEIGYGKHTYMCHVKVGGVEIGGTVEGVKRLNAETIAAWKACKILEEQADVGMVMSSDEEWHDADEGGGTQLKRPHS